MFFFFQAEDGIRDLTVTWSSDVCSSDLAQRRLPLGLHGFGDALGRGRRRDGHTDLRGLDLDLALVHAQLFRTERNASCGTSTRPTCFMRLFPSFWRSRSLRFRVMSPP